MIVPAFNDHFCIISKTTKNNANAVQSLNNDSHSKIKDSLLGAHTSLNKASTATGSVAEIMAPNKKHIDNGTSHHIKPRKKYSQNAITTADIKSQKTDNIHIDFQFSISLAYFILYQDSNIKTGRNI